jgi:hypothetical protein
MSTKRNTEPEGLALLQKLYPLVRRASHPNVACEALTMTFIGVMANLHPADRRRAAKRLKQSIPRMLKTANKVTRVEMEGGAQ